MGDRWECMEISNHETGRSEDLMRGGERLGWEEGAYEGSLLRENGAEHLQYLALGKLRGEGIGGPCRLRERGIEEGVHVPHAWAVSGIVDDRIGEKGERRVVYGPVGRHRRRGYVVVQPGNPLTMVMTQAFGSVMVGRSGR